MSTDVGIGAQASATGAARGRPSSRTRKALGWLARAGLVARGVVYAIIGILALKLALGDGGKATDQQGALQTIADQPFGKVLLVLRRDRAGRLRALAADPRRRRPRRRTARQRLRPHRGAGQRHRLRDPLRDRGRRSSPASGGGSGIAQEDDRRRPRLDGRHACSSAIAGAILIGVAVYQAYKGLARKFLEDAKTGEMSEPASSKAYTALGVFGLVARAVVFALIGYGLIKAAIDYDPKKAVGLDGALREARARLLRPVAARHRRRRADRVRRATRSPTPATARCSRPPGRRRPPGDLLPRHGDRRSVA